MGASTPTVVRKYTESWWDDPDRHDSKYYYSEIYWYVPADLR